MYTCFREGGVIIRVKRRKMFSISLRRTVRTEQTVLKIYRHFRNYGLTIIILCGCYLNGCQQIFLRVRDPRRFYIAVRDEVTLEEAQAVHFDERLGRVIVDDLQGIGTAGFVFALLGILLSWIPVVDFVIWFLGLLFSFIGLFKSPRGLAITGFILSIIGIIIIIAIFGSIAALLSKM